MNSIKKIIITLVLLWPSTLFAQTKFYVSPKGNGASSGTQRQVEMVQGSVAVGFLQATDVILSFNGVKVNKLRDLLEARRSVIGSGTEIVIFRNQKEIKMHVELNVK